MSCVNASLDCKLQEFIRLGLHRQAYLQSSLMIGH